MEREREREEDGEQFRYRAKEKEGSIMIGKRVLPSTLLISEELKGTCPSHQVLFEPGRSQSLEHPVPCVFHI